MFVNTIGKDVAGKFYSTGLQIQRKYSLPTSCFMVCDTCIHFFIVISNMSDRRTFTIIITVIISSNISNSSSNNNNEDYCRRAIVRASVTSVRLAGTLFYLICLSEL